MPIITPAYPSMCATFNITKSSMTIISRELKRGLRLTEDIMSGKRPWTDLFIKHTFFTANYKHYISVISASKTKEAHKIWSGYIESKARMLVQRLEQHPAISLAHAFVKGYERRHVCNSDHEIEQVQEGFLNFLAKDEPRESVDASFMEGQSDFKINPQQGENGSEDKPEPKEGNTEVLEQGLKSNGNSEGVDGISSEQPAIASADADAPDTSNGATSGTEIFTTTHYIGLELIEGKPTRNTLA